MVFRVALGNMGYFFRQPGAFMRALRDGPDVIGALAVADTLAFLLAVGAATSGRIVPEASWAFLGRFLVLYLLVFIVQCLFICFEAGCATLAGLLLGRSPAMLPMVSAMGYARVPLVAGALVYIFLPGACCLSALAPGAFGPTELGEAFARRIEVFELLTLGLQYMAMHLTGGLGKLESIGVLIIGWVAGTAIFHQVLISLLG